MSGESARTRSLPIGRYPGPACSYAVVDDTPVILSTNSAFQTQFGTVPEEEPVQAAFERFGLRVPDRSPPLLDRLTAGEEFYVRMTRPEDRTSREFLVQTVTPDDEVGFLLFVETTASDGGDWTAGTLGIDHVASVVSHDLRNPLDVAKARLEAGRNLGEDKHFDHVEQAHERMERIIQDVLTLARGEEVVNPDDELDLTAVVETAWETVETDGATLRVESQLPTATADPDRIGRLFENLFRNAVEHGSTSHQTRSDDAVEHGSTSHQTRSDDAVEHGSTSNRTESDDDSKHGATDSPSESDDSEDHRSGDIPAQTNDEPERRDGVTVTVGRLDNDPSGLYVADDGPGIPPAERQHVFEPGYSSDDHGTGLGLAIVARIADLHGWSIEVTESATGGARFEISDIGSNSPQ